MEINKLQVFLEVLKHNNLTKTAETLGYTQSGITHIINGIENEVGFRLLKRSRSGVFLTHEGEQIVQYFRELVKTNRLMNEKIMKIKNLVHACIRIGSFTSITLFLSP